MLVLSALGEVAFRELTVYFEQVPCDEIPNWMLPNLNVSPILHTFTPQMFNSLLSFQFAAIYIRGKKDLYFYEYMQEACGDGLLPFMIFYSGNRQIAFNRSMRITWNMIYLPEFMRKLQAKTLAAVKSRKAPLKIPTKTLLRRIPRVPASIELDPITMDEMFPGRSARIRNLLPTTRRIGFKFAGCCPVPAKPRKNLSSVKQYQQSAESLAKFSNKFVIGRRKLLKPIFTNNRPPIEYFMDHRWLNL